MKPNGCNEDGWDLYEQKTREEFEYLAQRRGYSLERDVVHDWFYAEQRTVDAWEMYHRGHVSGRVWNAD